MVGFVGPSGRHFTDGQRMAMFCSGSLGTGGVVGFDVRFSRSNKFALGASLAAAGLATKAAGAAGSGAVGVSLAGVASPAAVASASGVSRIGVPSVPGSSAKANVTKTASGATTTVAALRDDASRTTGALLGSVGAEFMGIGEPYVPTSGEMLDMNVDGFGVPVYSKGPSGDDLDIETVKGLVKKQYPGADVDTDVIMLEPDEYMDVALSKNPGREDEAILSNGFYSPTEDRTYLEIDDNGLNTLRAMIHEFVHDMSDDGVGDDLLNEGYADYVAYRIMKDEVGIPEDMVRKTLGYPVEAAIIEDMVDVHGRERVDDAFLSDHELGDLGG